MAFVILPRLETDEDIISIQKEGGGGQLKKFFILEKFRKPNLDIKKISLIIFLFLFLWDASVCKQRRDCT